MWFSALKLGLNAASHIYKKRQETKMAMADAQHMHAAKMAKGETEYQGKLLEARQSDWKDEADGNSHAANFGDRLGGLL